MPAVARCGAPIASLLPTMAIPYEMKTKLLYGQPELVTGAVAYGPRGGPTSSAQEKQTSSTRGRATPTR